MRRWVSMLGLSVVAGCATPDHAPQPGVFPATRLRGFGTVSGRLVRADEPTGTSMLEIRCENRAKAAIVQAKFLADMRLLPGVEEITLPGGLHALRAQGQGVLAAVLDGTRVRIPAAPDAEALAELAASASLNGLPSRPSADVPMFLDRWDRYGFRFYYRPFELPEDTPEQRRSYDYAREFDWAGEQHSSGIVFWNDPNRTDTAEGLMNEVWWDWAFRLARDRNLPVAINLSAGSGTASPWLLNRYRDRTQQRMPQYSGDFYAVADQGNGGHGTVSWNAGEAKDVELSLLQESMRRFVDAPNVVSWLEPHGELIHGAHDVFLEYGDVADRTFREFLQRKYGSTERLSNAWRGSLNSWSEVRVPELASFLGWGPEAIDLTGTWRVGYEPNRDGTEITAADLFNRRQQVDTAPAPEAWFAPGFDDSSWPEVQAPGNDLAMFLPQRPAVYRTTVRVEPDRLRDGNRWWLYVWDLNRAWGAPVRAVVNGRVIGESPIRHPTPHWDAYEATDALAPGPNSVVLRLPQGLLAYRVYLSPHPPVQYPDLPEGENTRWVDFCDWIRRSRLDACRRGVEMIRRVDAERPITLMHPDEYSDGIKELAEDYGAEFHNTGYMGGFYADYNALLMRGSQLPVSVEPGGPPATLAEYRRMMGLYFSEGVQSVDYFIHIGNVLWNEDIRREFEATQPLVHLFGKFHGPRAETAVLYSTRANSLTGFPWGLDPDTNLTGGYWRWNPGPCLRDRYPFDGITEGDFARSNAGRYRIVLDSNTSIMDETLLDEIEAYVRAGGVFVTFVQTGRHTPERKDAWPIRRLSGYRVAARGRHNPDGSVPPEDWRKLRPAPGQDIYRDDNMTLAVPANGLTLEAETPECRDLLLWEDGSVAAGMRPLGRGTVVTVGAKFHGGNVFDRVEPGGNDRARRGMTSLFAPLLEWRGIDPTPARLARVGAPDGPVILRRWVSNNGLYDVWTLWNQDAAATVTTDLVFTGNLPPDRCTEVVTGENVPLQRDAAGARAPGLRLEPGQTRAFLTPRNRIAAAPADWFALQRAWWRGTKAPDGKPLPEPPHKLSVDLTGGWAFRPVATSEEAEALAHPDTDDGAWERAPLGLWNVADRDGVRHALLRRRFTIPSGEPGGRTSLWLQSFFHTTFLDRGRIFLDGELVRDWSADALPGLVHDSLLPGTAHVLAVEVRSEGALCGPRGAAWLFRIPEPVRSLDLAGRWQAGGDVIRREKEVELPGPYDAFAMRRRFLVPADAGETRAVVSVEGTGPLLGVLINGRWVRRFHHMIGTRWDLDVTPWIRFGQENTVEILCNGSPGRGEIRRIAVDFHDPERYP